ncbi:MAG: hypothetical protein O7B26_01095 [Planctomycetota bacterium]|nr:hypothetical protein [Planctomycetota bacterium]
MRSRRQLAVLLSLQAMAGLACRDLPSTGTTLSSTPAGLFAAVSVCAQPFADCNCNDVPDDIDLANGTSQDCNNNGKPDDCERDCNDSGLEDSCDIEDGRSTDLNENGVPDECEDCNENGLPDDLDISAGTSGDCDGDGLPDECEFDCDGNGLADVCELAAGLAADANGNRIPDACDTVAAICAEFNRRFFHAVIESVRTDRANGYTRAEVTDLALSGCSEDAQLDCSTCVIAIIDFVYR